MNKSLDNGNDQRLRADNRDGFLQLPTQVLAVARNPVLKCVCSIGRVLSRCDKALARTPHQPLFAGALEQFRTGTRLQYCKATRHC